jgi:glyoxylase-like metal-dependent hydrolase (beta-lactamase superfamily II)
MFFRQFLNDETACASYLFGCNTAGELAVVDAHADLVDGYVAAAEAQGSRIAAVLETHVQADHVSGLPELVSRTGATAYMPQGSGVAFEHRELADGERVKLGNTVIEAVSTPGHATVHHAYLVTDHRRGEEPWMILTGDALLVGAVGRPDLHAHGELTVEEMAGTLYRSIRERLLTLPDHLLLYPGHYAGSVCGAGLSGNPASTIGFERRNNEILALGSQADFVEALVRDTPPPPGQQAEIVAANRAGRTLAEHA